MTLDEIIESTEIRFTGTASIILAVVFNLSNGTLLKLFPKLNIPQMNYNDILVIIVTILGAIYTVFKIANERLKYIEKKRQMKEEQEWRDKMNSK